MPGDHTQVELATRWTVRLAVLAYFVGATLRAGHGSSGQQKLARVVWTLGCLFYLAHVACAFQFFHHWSHAAAYQRTAEQTAAVTGWNWGGGLYFNYVFTAVWLADTVALWLSTAYGPPALWLGQSLSDAPAAGSGASPGRDPPEVKTETGQALPQPPREGTPPRALPSEQGSRTRWLEAAVQVFLWFMVFNATVVFGHGLVRWFGLAGCGWLAVPAGQRFARPRAVR